MSISPSGINHGETNRMKNDNSEITDKKTSKTKRERASNAECSPSRTLHFGVRFRQVPRATSCQVVKTI